MSALICVTGSVTLTRLAYSLGIRPSRASRVTSRPAQAVSHSRNSDSGIKTARLCSDSRYPVLRRATSMPRIRA